MGIIAYLEETFPELNYDDFDLILAFMDALTPTQRVTLDVWADKNIELTQESSKEAGPWRTDRTPYLREIMIKLSPTDPAQRIIFVKGAQVGATVSAIIAMLAYIAIDPCPMMYVLPTIQIGEGFSKDKLQPMIDACEPLKGLMKDPRARDSGNTIMGKRSTNGASINIAGANSAASLRSKTIKVIFGDEIDAYPRNIENEGSPITLLEKRQSTFGNQAKLYLASTPTVENVSLIQAEFEQTDQRYFFVPCPHCGAYHTFEFENLKWPDGHPEQVKMQCPECGDQYEDRYKEQILIKGEWRSTVPEKRNDFIIGYHLSSLYSPYGWLSWEKVVREYESAMKEMADSQEDNKMRAFWNTTLGKVYATTGERPAWKDVFENNREPYPRGTINNHVMVITMGVDIQKDRVELEIVGWGYDRRSWSVNYHTIIGDIDDPNVQQQLLALANMKFTRPDLVEVPVQRICMDANYNTTEVYRFISSQDPLKWSAVHGSAKTQRIFSNPQWANKTAKDDTQFTAMYYMLGVDLLKDELYAQLRKTKDVDDPIGPPGYCHFPDDYKDWHFMGLTAEQKIRKEKNGFARYEYEVKYKRNEQLDCFDDQTEVLTERGWIPFPDLTLNDYIATVDLESDLIEYQKPSQLVVNDHDGDMVELKGHRLDVLVTPGHRMVTYKKEIVGSGKTRKWNFKVDPKITLAKDLTIHHQIKSSATWKGSAEKYITIPACYSKQGLQLQPEVVIDKSTLAAFLGWYVSEGHSVKVEYGASTRRRIQITQNEGKKLDEIVRICEKLPWKFSVTRDGKRKSHKITFTNKQLYDMLKPYGKGSYDMRAPQWIKDSTPEIISIFLESAIKGDGWIQGSFRTYATVSKLLADDMQELFLKTGKASNIRIVPAKPYKSIEGKPGGVNTVDQYHVTELSKVKASLDTTINGGRTFLGRTVQYRGKVYCTTVPNGTLIVRRNGRAIIAGNCRNYARAALAMLGYDEYGNQCFDMIFKNYRQQLIAEEPKKKRKSDFW